MTCKDCVFAEWQMTKHATPRPDFNKYGKCTFNINDIFAMLPRSAIAPPPYKSAIHPNDVHDCPQHKRKES